MFIRNNGTLITTEELDALSIEAAADLREKARQWVASGARGHSDRDCDGYNAHYGDFMKAAAEWGRLCELESKVANIVNDTFVVE